MIFAKHTHMYTQMLQMSLNINKVIVHYIFYWYNVYEIIISDSNIMFCTSKGCDEAVMLHLLAHGVFVFGQV